MKIISITVDQDNKLWAVCSEGNLWVLQCMNGSTGKFTWVKQDFPKWSSCNLEGDNK